MHQEHTSNNASSGQKQGSEEQPKNRLLFARETLGRVLLSPWLWYTGSMGTMVVAGVTYVTAPVWGTSAAVVGVCATVVLAGTELMCGRIESGYCFGSGRIREFIHGSNDSDAEDTARQSNRNGGNNALGGQTASENNTAIVGARVTAEEYKQQLILFQGNVLRKLGREGDAAELGAMSVERASQYIVDQIHLVDNERLRVLLRGLSPDDLDAWLAAAIGSGKEHIIIGLQNIVRDLKAEQQRRDSRFENLYGIILEFAKDIGILTTAEQSRYAGIQIDRMIESEVISHIELLCGYCLRSQVIGERIHQMHLVTLRNAMEIMLAPQLRGPSTPATLQLRGTFSNGYDNIMRDAGYIRVARCFLQNTDNQTFQRRLTILVDDRAGHRSPDAIQAMDAACGEHLENIIRDPENLQAILSLVLLAAEDTRIDMLQHITGLMIPSYARNLLQIQSAARALLDDEQRFQDGAAVNVGVRQRN